MFAGRRGEPSRSTPPGPQLPCGGVTAARERRRAGAFPAGFTWGVATAAHQIEGGNVNNDWWAWEHDPASGTVEPSGDACDSFHRWREDVQLVADMGLGAYRFSLEWSRIEPAEGEFSLAALEHYRRVCAACHGHGIVPVVTFHHFTTPLWLTARGGWEAPDAPERFARFVERADRVPGRPDRVGLHHQRAQRRRRHGVLPGRVPAGGEGRLHALRRGERGDGARPPVGRRRAARRARETSRSASRSPWRRSRPPRAGSRCATPPRRCSRTSSCVPPAGDDFVGVQCYTRMHFGPDGLAPNDPDVPLTQMGDERWPQAVEHTVRRAAAVSGRPVVVTENGIATADDAERIAFVSDALRSAHRCLEEGIDLRGYFVLEPAGQFRVAPRLRPQVRAGGGGPRAPSSAGPSRARTGSAKWPAATVCARRAHDGVTGSELAATLGLRRADSARGVLSERARLP